MLLKNKMKLPAKVRYGIRILIILAQKQKKCTIKKLSKTIGVSSVYIRQVVIPLEKTGYIKSLRGKNGGLTIIKAPNKIKIINIFKAYKIDFDFAECVEDSTKCKESEICTTRKLLVGMKNSIESYLKSTTLSDLI